MSQQPPATSQPSREFLELPSKSAIDRRFQLDAQRPASKPEIGAQPRSALLDRLHSFLPAMQQANVKLESQLQERPAEDFDIEHLGDGEDSAHIEMDLTCGILDLKDDAAVAAAEQRLAGGGPDEALLAVAGGVSSSESDSDSSEDEGMDSKADGVAGGVGQSKGQQKVSSTSQQRKAKKQKPRKIQEL